MENWRSWLTRPVERYMPPVYRVAKKVDPGEDEQKVIAYYENSFVLHVASILTCVPAMWQYFRHIHNNKDLFKDLRPAFIRTVAWSSMAFNIFVVTYYYDNWHKPKDAQLRLEDKYRHEIKQEMIQKAINRNH